MRQLDGFLLCATQNSYINYFSGRDFLFLMFELGRVQQLENMMVKFEGVYL